MHVCARARASLPLRSYLPGAIVRVKLSHFVTYDAVEFHPGPYLNMIIGPNGTGKSTVVCAIALGLGWKPSVLGRAKDVAAYVKQGYDDGWIEIELKGHFQKGEKNVVIRRLITKKANKSQWLLNGKSATQKDVINVVASLNIQIENLCSFLPQDKVAEFARMQPSELLKETQRATGGQRLTRWHERLIQLGKTDREITAKLEKDRSEIANLQERNEVLQRDVRRYEERRRIETAVSMAHALLHCQTADPCPPQSGRSAQNSYPLCQVCSKQGALRSAQGRSQRAQGRA